MFPFSSMLLATGSFTLSISPSSASGSGYNGATETSNSVTVTPVGPGGFTYTYAWARVSGSSLITATAASAATTAFSGVTPNDSTINATFRCTATRSDGQTATVDVAVALTASAPPPVLSAVVTPNSVFTSVAGGSGFSEGCTCTPSNGVAPYTYAWSPSEAGGHVSPSTGSTTTFSIDAQASGNHGLFHVNCLVTDNVGATVSAQAFVDITWT